MSIARINIQSDGNEARTSTMTLFTRTAEDMQGVRNRLPGEITGNGMTIADGNKLYIPIDGSLTSSFLSNALLGAGLPEAGLLPLRPILSEAVIKAQVGSGLANFGITGGQSHEGAVSTTVASTAPRDTVRTV